MTSSPRGSSWRAMPTEFQVPADISQRCEASLRRVLVKCGLSLGRSEANGTDDPNWNNPMAFLGYSSSATGLLQRPSVIYLHRGGGATWSFRKGATAQTVTPKARLNQAGLSW